MAGIMAYRLAENRAHPLQVLSDGLNIAYVDDSFILDLDPGPDEWSLPSRYDETTVWSKQYIQSRDCSFEVFDGPFI